MQHFYSNHALHISSHFKYLKSWQFCTGKRLFVSDGDSTVAIGSKNILTAEVVGCFDIAMFCCGVVLQSERSLYVFFISNGTNII